METCRQKAMRWVHRYALGGAAFAALPTSATSAGLSAIELHMLSAIGEIYGEALPGFAAATAGTALGAASKGLKKAVGRMSQWVPVLGPVVRMAVAGVSIEVLGHALVRHYEGKYPNKVVAAPS